MDKTINIAGRTIFYRVYGKGQPVMLVHGFGETGELLWHHQVDYLQNKFQLIVPDLPGSGASGMIDDMSIEGMAAIIKPIADAERISSFILVGHSMGGYVSLAFTEKYPGYVNALGLFHSTAYPDSEEKKSNRRKGIEFMEEHGGFEFLKTTAPNLFSPITKSSNAALITSFIQQLNNFSKESLVSYYKAMINRPDRTHILNNSKTPILFIMGETDNAVPISDGLKLCHLPEMAYIHVLKKSGHMGMLEEAETSNKMLEKFIVEVAGSF